MPNLWISDLQISASFWFPTKVWLEKFLSCLNQFDHVKSMDEMSKDREHTIEFWIHIYDIYQNVELTLSNIWKFDNFHNIRTHTILKQNIVIKWFQCLFFFLFPVIFFTLLLLAFFLTLCFFLPKFLNYKFLLIFIGRGSLHTIFPLIQ